MKNFTHARRGLALLLVLAGAVMIFLAPDSWGGVALLALGVSVEAIAIVVRHRADSAARTGERREPGGPGV
jgi:hypothetical protein